MEQFQRSPVRVLSAGVALLGAFLLYWGIMGIASVSYPPSVTVPWLDRALFAASRYVWVPAVGVFLIAGGLSPAIAVGARRSRIVRWVLGGVGVAVGCLGVFFTFVAINSVAGFVFLTPLFLAGVVLIGVALGGRGYVPRDLLPV